MYCNLDDLKKRLKPEVLKSLLATQDSGQSITRAKETVDSFLSVRYQLPLITVPGVIKDLALDLATFYMFGNRGFDNESEDWIIEKQYNEAIKSLKEIRDGKRGIGIPEKSTTIARQGATPKVRTAAKRFTAIRW